MVETIQDPGSDELEPTANCNGFKGTATHHYEYHRDTGTCPLVFLGTARLDLLRKVRGHLGLLGAPPPPALGRGSLLAAAAPARLVLRRLPLGGSLPARSTTSLRGHDEVY